jgi:hypothetical protein
MSKKENNLALADKIESYSYMKSFSSEEMEEMRIELADKSIQLKGQEEELKDIKDVFKNKMKPNKERVNQLLTYLHQKAEAITEECSVLFEQDAGVAVYYSQLGVEVGRRPLVASEREATIFTELRKTGTNE